MFVEHICIYCAWLIFCPMDVLYWILITHGSRIHRYDIVSSSGARYMGVRGFQKA